MLELIGTQNTIVSRLLKFIKNISKNKLILNSIDSVIFGDVKNMYFLKLFVNSKKKKTVTTIGSNVY